MKFLSSRGGSRKYSFKEAALVGMGEDGGLLLPERLPKIDKTEQRRWRQDILPVQRRPLHAYATDTASQALRIALPSLVRRSYRKFRLPETIRIRQLVPTTREQTDGWQTRETQEKEGASVPAHSAGASHITKKTPPPHITKAGGLHRGATYTGGGEEQHAKDGEVPGLGPAEDSTVNGGDGGDKIFLLELFHGPTFAFKDIALQFLGTEEKESRFKCRFRAGELLAHLQREEKKPYVVLGATSGDTGSAAIAALKNKSPRLHTIILFPKDRVSPVQKMQMVTTNEPTVHCLQVDGTFDDCQEMVKAVLKGQDLQQQHNSYQTAATAGHTVQNSCPPATTASGGRLCVVNSINCMRILVQAAYWWYAALQLEKLCHEATGDSISPSRSYPTFVVPTGNFGNIFSCLIAKTMEAPIGKLLLATNSNDVLVQAYRHGFYQKRGSVCQTCSPSMDIAAASNFERLLLLEKLLRTQQHRVPSHGEETVQQQLPQACTPEKALRDAAPALARPAQEATASNHGEKKGRWTEKLKAENWVEEGFLPRAAALAATRPTAAALESCVLRIAGANWEDVRATPRPGGHAPSVKKGQCKYNDPEAHERCATSTYVIEASKAGAGPFTAGARDSSPDKTQNTLHGSAPPSAEERIRGTQHAEADVVHLSTNVLHFFRKYFLAVSVDDEDTKAAIRNMFTTYNEIIDPHTAVGYAAYLKTKEETVLRPFTRTEDTSQMPQEAELCTGGNLSQRTALQTKCEKDERERCTSNLKSKDTPTLQGPTNSHFLQHQLEGKEARRSDTRVECERRLLSPCSSSTYLLACTAHFGKFPETVLPQVGWEEEKRIPQELRNLNVLQQHFQDIPSSADLLRDLVKKVFTLAAEDDCA